ncbi:type I secretion system permease/ATPase [Aliiroseovarius sp. PTFE2010]|uniref:type I secretion system permease/ATPase n=1 Tax=Aliiroseovarius sp. PTFE2010 TaxID=3417190 RepID=UPI003CE8A534
MASRAEHEKGLEELRTARRANRTSFWAVGLFSAFVNLLMLTGPLFMLQVYDRVLGSRSEATLVALVVLVAFLYLMMGILDTVRGLVLGRIGADFQSRLDGRVFSAALRKAALSPTPMSAPSSVRDLESVQRFITSPVLGAFYDLPFTPLFLFGIALFHPYLGILAIAGGIVLVGLTIANQLSTRQPLDEANRRGQQAEYLSEQLRSEAEMVRSLGLTGAAFRRWNMQRERALKASITAQDRQGSYRTASKTFRLFLQSAILGLGAYLVLQREITPGAMIASSILLGRALQPIEMIIGQWALITRARKGWAQLADLLGEIGPEEKHTQLPKPKAQLVVDQLTVLPPGEAQASLRMVSFALKPGEAMGVIGASGAGKSTLARALTGVWRAAGGKIRLDGAALDQYDPDVLGEHIGYLPQRVQLFDGTIAENIANLSMQPDDAKVVEAAKKAAAHEMILKLPKGYDTRVTSAGGRLSGGQVQRIGLARALYGDPVIVVLDEPNSNLDNEGSQALNAAIRQLKTEGKAVLIMAHRPAAIQECDTLLVLEGGARRAFGPRDEVLKDVVANAKDIAGKPLKGGVQ